MTHESSSPPSNLHEARHRRSLWHRLRGYFIAGLLVTAPVGITFWLAWLVLTFIDSRVTPLIPVDYNPNTYLPFVFPGLGLIILIVAMTIVNPEYLPMLFNDPMGRQLAIGAVLWAGIGVFFVRRIIRIDI